MSELTLESLAKRIEALEKQAAEKTAQQAAPDPKPKKDWRRSVGMYADREVAKQIEAEGAAIRQAEREAARREDAE